MGTEGWKPVHGDVSRYFEGKTVESVIGQVNPYLDYMVFTFTDGTSVELVPSEGLTAYAPEYDEESIKILRRKEQERIADNERRIREATERGLV